MTRGATTIPGSATAARRGAGAFTLIEMLVVLSIIAVLMGIAIGALRRTVPTRALARNKVEDALRQARLFALQENAPAVVHLDESSNDLPPTVTALGKRTVGNWHLEGDDLTGFPQDARAAGQSEEPMGVIGRAMRLSATEPGWIDCGKSPSYDSHAGFAFELWVKLDAPRTSTLLTKGKAVVLRAETDGTLTLQVRLRDPGPPGATSGAKEVFSTATAPRGSIAIGRFVKLAGAYDGLAVRLSVDDAVADEQMLQKPLPFEYDADAPLLIGSYDAPAGFAVDEVKWAVYAGDTQELNDIELAAPHEMVRFGPDGALDPQFHAGPAEVVLVTPPSEPDQPPLKTVIRIGALGDIH